MSEVDQYEYLKSCEPQGINLDTPYVSKNWNFCNDINNSIYSGAQGLTLVQYNLSNIYNSSVLTNMSECYLIIPTVTCVRLTNTGTSAAVAPSVNAFAIASLKTNTASIVHSIDLAVDGKTITQITPYSNLMFGFDMASKMSKSDLALKGKQLGFSSCGLDNPYSMVYTGNFGANNSSNLAYGAQTNGNQSKGGATPGFANNQPYGNGNNMALAQVGTASQSQYGPQNYGTINNAIQERVLNTTFLGTTANNFGVTIANANTYNQEFKPYSQIINNDIIYYDYLYINLGDISHICSNIGLVRSLNATLRIYLNTGMITVAKTPVNTAYSLLTYNGTTTFTNTCPITINSLGLTTNYSADPFTDITASFTIGRSSSYAITTAGGASVNFGANYSSQIQATRFYYPSIVLDPLKMSDYLASQQSKTVLGRQFLYNTYNNIQVGASFSQLIQSGVRNITSIVILPLISQVVNGFSDFTSPFSVTGGCGGNPLSLINLNVLVGGVQLRTSSLSYTWEDYIQEVALYNKSSSSEYGVESTIVTKEWWDNNRFYVMNVRNTLDDALTPRNVVINFVNNNNVPIDVYFFIVYEDEWVLNCATGQINAK